MLILLTQTQLKKAHPKKKARKEGGEEGKGGRAFFLDELFSVEFV